MIVFLVKQVKTIGHLGAISNRFPQNFAREAGMQSEIPKIKQESRGLSADALDIHSNAIMLLPREPSALKTLPYGDEIA